MADKVLLGDIKGPKGDVGAQGPPGSNGINAVWDGAGYTPTDGAINYVGPQDPGDVVNGSIWFDTS